jgi:hypothetical protein
MGSLYWRQERLQQNFARPIRRKGKESDRIKGQFVDERERVREREAALLASGYVLSRLAGVLYDPIHHTERQCRRADAMCLKRRLNRSPIILYNVTRQTRWRNTGFLVLQTAWRVRVKDCSRARIRSLQLSDTFVIHSPSAAVKISHLDSLRSSALGALTLPACLFVVVL